MMVPKTTKKKLTLFYHFAGVFKPNQKEISAEEEKFIHNLLDEVHESEKLLKLFTICETQKIIKSLKPNKASEYDLITVVF